MSSPRHVLRPLIFVSSILGTLPYTRNLKFSTVLLFCGIFINAVPSAYMLNAAIKTLMAIQHYPAYFSVLQVAKIICCMACMANLYFLFRRRAMFLLILANFEEIHKFCSNSSGVGMQQTRRQMNLIIYTILTIGWAISLLNIAIAPHNYSLSILTSLIMYLVVATTLHSLGSQFLSFSILMKFYLKQINSKIVDLQKLHLTCTKNENVSKRIDDLRLAHNMLCENAHLINQVYGIYLLLPLSYISIHLQSDVFSIIRNILDCVTEFPYNSLGVEEWLITIMWIINDIYKLGTYFRVAYLVRIEVKLDNIVAHHHTLFQFSAHKDRPLDFQVHKQHSRRQLERISKDKKDNISNIYILCGIKWYTYFNFTLNAWQNTLPIFFHSCKNYIMNFES